MKFAGDSAKIGVVNSRLRRRVPEAHDAIGIRERQRPQHHGVDDGEDRGVDADAEAENDDAGEREARAS